MRTLVCAVLAAVATASPLDDLVHALQGSQGKQHRPSRGDLPDLHSMRHDLHGDSWGRLSSLSSEDLVQVLKAIGYGDAAVSHGGQTVLVLVDDPRSSSSIHGQELRGKAGINARADHRSLELLACISVRSDMEVAAKVAFTNNWNERKRFTQAFAHDDDVCLQRDILFTKYDKANLEALAQCMKIFVSSYKDFSTLLGRYMRALPSWRRLTTSSLEELLEHVKSQQEQESVGGELPALDGLLTQIKSDNEERLSKPSPEDLVHMLKALGFNDTVADDNGDSLSIFLDDRLNQVTVHDRVVRNKVLVTAAPIDNSFTVYACLDSNNDESADTKISMVNAWNTKRRFTQAYWHKHHGICLEMDVSFTKYSKANLQLLQQAMGLFALQVDLYHATWVAAILPPRRLQFV